jgi:hypothetical protein
MTIGCGKANVLNGRKCGDYYCGEKVLCDECTHKFEKQYPQGWVGYPGDTCVHGVYVGGCMEDRMCGRCENGER